MFSCVNCQPNIYNTMCDEVDISNLVRMMGVWSLLAKIGKPIGHKKDSQFWTKVIYAWEI